MRYAAFDLSSNTGAAVWDGRSAAPLLIKKRILYWDRDEGVMLEHWRNWLGRFFAEHNPGIVAVEAAAAGNHGDVSTMNRQAMLAGMLYWACHVKGLPPVVRISPGTWRKTFIGFGARGKRVGTINWKRLAMQRCDALGWEYNSDHNCAEAGGVLDHLITTTLKHTPPWRAAQAQDGFLPLPEVIGNDRQRGEALPSEG